MFDNLINRHDVAHVVGKIRRDGLNRLASAIRPSSRARVQHAWHHSSSPPRHWGSIPAVRRRWNRLISGHPDVDLRRYTAEHHLVGRSDLVALSLACGAGANERRWAETGMFARIDGIDISPTRIQAARREAREAGSDHLLHFEVADVRTYEFDDAAYDVVIAESALHHISGLHELAPRLRRAMKRGGLLILNDFVGPARFQWTDSQLEITSNLLRDLPEKYRRRWKTGAVKTSFHRPGRLMMWLSDPSEAVESDVILTALSDVFETVELRPYGGTILQLLFDDIAHNFLDGSEETAEILRHCFEVEDAALASGDIESDFVYGVFRAR